MDADILPNCENLISVPCNNVIAADVTAEFSQHLGKLLFECPLSSDEFCDIGLNLPTHGSWRKNWFCCASINFHSTKWGKWEWMKNQVKKCLWKIIWQLSNMRTFFWTEWFLHHKWRAYNTWRRFSNLNAVLFKIRDINTKQKKRTDFLSVIRKCILCKVFILYCHFMWTRFFLEKRLLAQSSDFTLTINPSSVTNNNFNSVSRKLLKKQI